MAVGIDLDSEYLERGSIPSGGAGTLTDGAFANSFVGVWVYRPSSTATRDLTLGGSIIEMQAGAREVIIGFNSAGATLADLNLQVTFNSGGGAGTPYLFTGYAGDDYLDEWVYYFILENSTSGQIAGYILLSDLNNIAASQTRANDNAGSQYCNTLTFGNNDGHTACVLGYYAYARARYGTGITTADALTYAASGSTIAGDWGFWPLADNTDTGDDSGNGYTLTFGGTLTSETSPSLVVNPVITVNPVSSTIYEGQTSTFTVTATGTGTLHYQWKDDGSNVGTDSNSYTTAAGVYADNGAQITCVVTDDLGSATSSAATWRVIVASRPFYLRA